MSAVSLAYFEYPKNKQSEENFLGWCCSVCREEDSTILGGTVAHGSYDSNRVQNDGRKHPIHRYCLLSLTERSTYCTNCRACIDAGNVISLWMKCRRAALRIYHFFPTLYADSRIWLSHPLHRVYLGFACMLFGFAKRKHPLTSLGLGLQALGIHEAVEYGSSHMQIVRRVESLAKGLILDMQKGNMIQLKLRYLKEIATDYPPYCAQIAPWIDSQEKKKVLGGLINIEKAAKAAIYNEGIIRFWRALSGDMIESCG